MVFCGLSSLIICLIVALRDVYFMLDKRFFMVMRCRVLLVVYLLGLTLQAGASNEEWWQYYNRNKAIHLQFSDQFHKDYEINVVWTPDSGLSPVLNGPALINFRSKKWENSFSVGANYFHLPQEILKESGLYIFDSDYVFNLSVNLGKTYEIKNNSKYLKQISLWGNDHTTKEMSLDARSHIPFFFEDIDLDGEDELIVTSFRSGQRGVNEYLIYDLSYKYGTPVVEIKHLEPFNQIDQLSAFDFKHKTISQYSSGGSCSNLEDAYRLVNGNFQHIRHTNWNYRVDVEHGSICVETMYDIISDKKVPIVESKSYWDSNKLKYINFSIERFNKNSQEPLYE